MDERLRDAFLERWQQYFAGADLPIGYYYADQVSKEDLEDTRHEGRCLICNLERVRAGHTLAYHAKSPGCPGGKRYTGFVQKLRPDFEYFLSCGIPGEMEGDRYEQCPQLVREYLAQHSPYVAPGE